jgi:hypothetical protein
MFDLSDEVLRVANLRNAEKRRVAVIEDLRIVVEVIPILVTALVSSGMTTDRYKKVIEVSNNLDSLIQKVVSRIHRNAAYATELNEISTSDKYSQDEKDASFLRLFTTKINSPEVFIKDEETGNLVPDPRYNTAEEISEYMKGK